MSQRCNVLVAEAARDLRHLNGAMLVFLLFARAAGWLAMETVVLMTSLLLLLGSYFLALGCLPEQDDNDKSLLRWKRFLVALGMSVSGLSLPVLTG